MTTQISDYSLDYSDKVKPARNTGASTIADVVQEKFLSVSEISQEIAGEIKEAVQPITPAVDKTLREQPMLTLAGATVVGFVLGALWKK